MRVKICGITSLADALDAIASGAHALGFVFYKPSPRYITPQDAKKIINQLPPFVEKVGLFVNEDAMTINAIAKESSITLSQIHFEADTDLYKALDHPFIRVIRAQKKEDIHLYENEYRLIDAYCEAYGGMGKQLNIEWFNDIDCSKIILAGGLTPSNVALTCKYGFYGVDVSSGVEKAKGIKDSTKVSQFIQKAIPCQ
ncbi:MAG: phosphoribosylanthranilate isomerase [Campylobacterota bacterium]|nr:phosphoribosylanthranilate isomerase [Campylobacterota bacterium]